MPGTGGFAGSSTENIQHFGAVRTRITGSGNLIPTFIGLDSTLSSQLASIVMSTTSGREPRVLANFVGQRARLEFKTVNANEFFNVNRIIIFIKPMYTEFPG